MLRQNRSVNGEPSFAAQTLTSFAKKYLNAFVFAVGAAESGSSGSVRTSRAEPLWKSASVHSTCSAMPTSVSRTSSPLNTRWLYGSAAVTVPMPIVPPPPLPGPAAPPEFIAVFSSEQRTVSTCRRGVCCASARVYGEGVESNALGGVYICLERSTRRRRSTSTLFWS